MRLGWLVVVLVLVLATSGGVAAWVLDDTGSGGTPASDPPTTSTAAPAQQARLVLSRVVELNGTAVRVEETIAASDGEVTVVPSQAGRVPGLRHKSSVLASGDGTTKPFTGPARLSAGGSITIIGRYELTRCPDVLPTRWPTPSKVVPGNWSRTVVRSESPQRTARALCADARHTAKELRGLTGTMGAGGRPVVRLKWRGSGPLTVRAVGSASGVAAIGRGRGCPGDCLTRIPRGQAANLRLQAVEPCPVGSRSRQLTLIVENRESGTRVIELMVANLGRQLCSAADR